MANNLDYIKSYLIKLGVDIDSNEISKWESGLKKVDSGFKSTVSKLVSSYKGIASIYTSMGLAIAKFASSVADSDMELQRLSKTMYMSRDSAKALKTTLDSMGLGISDLRDIALNPELTRQYRELISLSQSIGTPKAVKDSLKDIRGINFELNKTRTIISYFIERVTHFIYDTARGPAQKFRNFMVNFNTRFAKNIGNWAESLGKVLGNVLRLVLRLGETLLSVVSVLGKVWDKLSGISKGFIGALFLINRIIKGSPIWRLVTIFTSFLMLLDDYKTFREGGISANLLKPVWKVVEDQRKDPNSGWNFLINSIKSLIDSINSLIEWFKEFIIKLEKSLVGRALGFGEDKPRTFTGENPTERIINQQRYVENVSFWDRFLSDISGGRFGISQEQFLTQIQEGNNLTPIIYPEQFDNRLLNEELTPITTNNMTPITTNNSSINNSSTNSNINQTFNFNVSNVKDPNRFVQDVSTIIRNNRSRLVGA